MEQFDSFEIRQGKKVTYYFDLANIEGVSNFMST